MIQGLPGSSGEPRGHAGPRPLRPGGIRGSRRQRLRCSPDPPAATRNFPSAAAAGALEQRRGRWIKYKTSCTSGLSRPKSPRSCCAEARLGRGRAVPCQPGGSGLPPTPPHYCRAYAPWSGRTGGGRVSAVPAARAGQRQGRGHGQPQRPARTPTGPPPSRARPLGSASLRVPPLPLSPRSSLDPVLPQTRVSRDVSPCTHSQGSLPPSAALPATCQRGGTVGRSSSRRPGPLLPHAPPGLGDGPTCPLRLRQLS